RLSGFESAPSHLYLILSKAFPRTGSPMRRGYWSCNLSSRGGVNGHRCKIPHWRCHPRSADEFQPNAARQSYEANPPGTCHPTLGGRVAMPFLRFRSLLAALVLCGVMTPALGAKAHSDREDTSADVEAPVAPL